jgi:periplasmic protein TonB
MNERTQPDILDILFAQRNRAYGAYALRRAYPANVGKALGWSFLFIAAMIFLPHWLKAVAASITAKPDEGFTIELAPPPATEVPPPVLPKTQMPAPATRATQAFPPPKVLEDDLVSNTEPPVIDSILADHREVGVANIKGPTDVPPALDVPSQNGIGLFGDGPKRTIRDTVYSPVDVQKPPSFPGGEPALLRYLAEHIRYPEIARESNIQGVVAIGFVVDERGRITDAKILKDIGGGCGKVAQNIIENMPPWSPGEANGHAVRVRFTLPVRFELK